MQIKDRIKEFKRVRFSELKANQKNWRKHPQKQKDAMAGVLRSVGWADAVLARETSQGLELIDGHLRKEIAEDAEVPVLVLDVTDEEADLILATHDPLAEMAETDQELLNDLVSGLEFDDTDTTKLLDTLSTIPTATLDEGSDIELPDDPETEVGDLIILGEHRLLCGDCTDAVSVAGLMDGRKADLVFADPPYGVNFQSNSRTKTKKFDVLKNDDKLLIDWVDVCKANSEGWVFVWTSWKVVTDWISICSQFGNLSNVVIWSKGGGGLGDLENTFSTDFEIALVYNRETKLTGKRIGSVWSVPKDAAASYMHPTQKPVELPAMAIRHTTNKGDLVLDPFLGSGTSLIAAEQLGRVCYGLELSPAYCDVIVKRWEEITGNKARRIKQNG